MVFPALAPAAFLFTGFAIQSAHAQAVRDVDLLPSTHYAAIPVAEFSVPLVEKTPRRHSKTHALHSLRKSKKGNSGAPFSTILDGADFDFEYLAPIDTPGSDTWLAEKGFKCMNLTGHAEPAATCGFGSEGFNAKQSKSFKPYPDSKFSIAYGDGEYLAGTAGYETVSVGGLTVPNQVIGLVNKAAWVGDGINTGLLGLAYPSLTSVKSVAHGDRKQYPPFFFNAVQQKKISQAYFSIAINRGTEAGKTSKGLDKNLGYLSFGGIPPVPVIQSTSATVPLQAFTAGGRVPVAASPPSSSAHNAPPPHSSYFYYTVDISAFIFPNSTAITGKGTANNRTIIDSGTTLNLLPSPVAQAYNGLWKSASWHDGAWYVNCTDTPPPFAVAIGGGGHKFTISPKDLVVPVGTDDKGTQLCVSGIQDGGEDEDGAIFILGDVFMHNVVSVFDIYKNEMTFVQRKEY
ncbi:Acid protease [Mycena kentingensis (nom. inval.)]|nr:Acid protease [Mycena kentingensis (nom. inval.)]